MRLVFAPTWGKEEACCQWFMISVKMELHLTQQFVLCPAQVVEDVLKAVFKIKREEVLQMV
jgi:hypothetical protein